CSSGGGRCARASRSSSPGRRAARPDRAGSRDSKVRGPRANVGPVPPGGERRTARASTGQHPSTPGGGGSERHRCTRTAPVLCGQPADTPEPEVATPMVSTALELSALERKDRDELMTIAQALGGKPGSRAKKADIIDLILELTGVSTGGDGAEADDAKAGEVPDAAADQPAGKDEPAKGDDASAGDAGGDDAKATATRSRRSRSKAKAAEPAVAADEPPAEWELEAGGDDASANGQPPTDTAPKGGQPQGQQAAQDGGDQADADDSPNRRRRRRGRNRDRGSDQAPEEYTGEPIEVEGLLDLRDEGYGFLRVDGLLPSRDDVYISVKQARQFGLRKGDHLRGASRPALRNEK